jgi:PAS domain S-box-containing protein
VAYIKQTKAELLEELKALRDRLGEQERARAGLEELIKALASEPPAEEPRREAVGGEQVQDAPAESIHKLQKAYEGLRVAEEELRRRNEELAIAQLAAEKERTRYQDLFNSAPSPFLVTDADGIIHEANRLAENMLNVPRQELAGKSLLLFIAQEHRKEFMSRLSTFKESGKSEKWELLIQPQGREAFHAEITVTQAHDPSDKNATIRWLIHDITERKQAEWQLKEMAEKYATLFNTTSDGVWINNLNGEILEVNDAYCRMSGYSRDELTHMSLGELEALESPDEIANRIRRIIETGGQERFESQHRRKDGSILDLDITALYFAKEGGRFAVYARDITERKHAEEALRENERDLNRAQAVARTGSWRMNVRKNELLWSEETYRIFRIQRGTPMTYERFLDSVHPGDRDYVDRMWKAALSGEPYDIEHRILAGERVKWVRERAELEFDKDGSLLGGFGTAQDITELKQAEEALRESKDRYQALFESIDEGFCIIEAIFDASGKPVDYRFLEANPAFEVQTGLRDAVGKRMREMEPRHEEYWFETYGRIALTGEPERFTNQAKYLDNRWYDVYAFRVGRPEERKVAILFNDITERRSAEEQVERQSAVLDAINRIFQKTLRSETEEEVARICLEVAEKLTGSAFGFVGETNKEGAFDTIALSNPGWAECRMQDSEKTKMIMGMKIRGYWSKPLTNGRSVIVNDPANHPERVGVPEGHPPITSFLGVPFMRDGKATGIIGLANKPAGYTLANQQDVEALSIAFIEALERKRADIALRESEARFRNLSESLEETVRQKTAELVQAEHMAAIGQMVSTVAHEVRNPIHVIRTATDALREAPHDEQEKREILGEIEYGVKMLAVTVSELLEYSKPLKLKFSHTTVKDIVEAALKLLAEKLKNITTRVELERADEEINVDAVKFTQVLANIMSNSADAMPGGGSLQIRSRILERRDAKLLEIAVTDTGHGIDERHLDDIFKPFFTTKTRGTGLGLAICKKIMDAHHGTMNITSKIGEGTTVELPLPIENTRR